MSNNFYFKSKPNSFARVMSIASIEMPLFRKDSHGDYYAGLSIPDSGTARKVKINDIFMQGTDDMVTDENPAGNRVAGFVNSKLVFDTDDFSKAYDFATPEEYFSYRYGSDPDTTVNPCIQGDDVSFQSIYCEWDRYKFGNFVIESLVGKALTNAIAYNYFGYPVNNVARRADLNFDNDDGTVMRFGRMPNFGDPSPSKPIPDDNLSVTGGTIGRFSFLRDEGGTVTKAMAGDDPKDLGRGLKEYFSEETNDDLDSRYLWMLGAARRSSTAFVEASEFQKYYTNSFVYEIRFHPGDINWDGTATPNVKSPPSHFPGLDGVSGYSGGETVYGHLRYLYYDSGKCPDTSFRTIENYFAKTQLGADAFDFHLPTMQKSANAAYDSYFQPLTKTYAKLWMPSLVTAIRHSPLHHYMDSGFFTPNQNITNNSMRRTKWFKDHIDDDDLSGIPVEGPPQAAFDASFKTSNLVTMFKLVPAGIEQKDVQKYLDNPHYTLNNILPQVLEYITQVVPQNPRFAGPKPATKEPDSKTERFKALNMEMPYQADNPDIGCNQLQTQRVLSGSFFELQLGRKWINAPLTSRDPREKILENGVFVDNKKYSKISQPEAKMPEGPKYKIGSEENERWWWTDGSVPQKNIDYATKFGLWNNDWIGATSTKYWQNNGEYQRADDSNLGPEGDYYAVTPGGFMLLPDNPNTATSMINSLPSYGLGMQTLSDFLEAGSNPKVLTKLMSDLWLSYHFAVKPNGMGFYGSYWASGVAEQQEQKNLWNKFRFLKFRVNTEFEDKIDYLKDSGIGIDDTIIGPPIPGSISVFKHENYDDIFPLLSPLYGNGGYSFDEVGWSADTVAPQDYLEAYTTYQTTYAGHPAQFLANSVIDMFGNYGAAEFALEEGWNGGYEQDFSVMRMKMSSVDQSEKIAIIKNALHFNQAQVADVYRGTNVPIMVGRYSIMEFPIWNWKRGGVAAGGYGNLDSINWQKLIQEPEELSGMSSDYYTEEVLQKWKPYLDENPFIINNKRECVPRWVEMLRIYPTVRPSALKYGWVPDTLVMSKNTVEFTLDNTGIANALLSNYQGGNQDGYGGSVGKNYAPGQQNHFDVNEGYTTKDFFVIGEPGAAGYFGQGAQGGVAFYQKQYFADQSSDGFPYLSYKESELIHTNCVPYMTMNFQWDNNISSVDYRNYTHNRFVTLSYAAELAINEIKLVIDLVKMGIVALAGESEDYVGLGMDLNELFTEAFGKGNSFYTDSLKKAYKTFEESYLALFAEDLGVSIDFSNFPTVEVSDRVTKENIEKAVQRQLNIPNKIEEYRDQYPNIENIEALDNPGPISSFIADYHMLPKEVPLYSQPGQGSEIIGYVKNFTTVKVLKEWVNGGKLISKGTQDPVPQGQWNKIQIVDKEAGDLDEKIGYVRPNILQPIESGVFFATPDVQINSSFASGIDSADKPFNSGRGIYDPGGVGGKTLKLSYTEVKPMSDMARALAPTWWKLQEPFYHYEDGEYWVNVELKGENCIIDEADLMSKSDTAEKAAIRALFEFYNKTYTESDVDRLTSAYLVSRVEDYHLDLRPGSSVRFLVKVGAIYIKAFPDVEVSLESKRSQAVNQVTLNQQYYATHISQGIAGLNRMYIEIQSSKYALKGIDLLQEMKRFEFTTTVIKKILSVNNITPTASDDNLIEIGFDGNYGLVYVAYKKHDEDKFKLLNIGIEHFKNLMPMNNPNTMSLLYHHRLLRNPMLKWQQAIKKYFVNPKPEIIEKDINNVNVIPASPCRPFNFIIPRWEQILGPLAEALDRQLQLDPRFDFGSFQFSLLSYFPPCPKPPAGKGTPRLLGEFDVNGEKYTFEDLEALSVFSKAVDGGAIKEYVGDWVASAGALEDIQHKVIDLDDLMEYVLDYIDPPTLYSKICKCFLDQIGIDTLPVPSLEINASAGSVGANIKPNLGSSALSGENEGEYSAEFKGPSYDGPKSFKDLKETEEMDAGDLICSFCFEIPSFFLRLPTTNIMDILIDALLMALEFILSQLLLELIKALLDILLQCPEITCPEGEKQVKDYGGQDLGQIFSNPNYDLPSVDDYFSECGILIDGEEVTGDMVLELMTNISQRLSSGEVLGLIGGNITNILLDIAEEEISKFPSIKAQLHSKPRIEDFFSCAGLGLPAAVLADIEDDITDKYQNPELCTNLLADAKKQLSDRCGVNEIYDESAKRALQFDIDKYRALADAIRKNQDLSQQLPPIFGDCQGNQGVLTGLPNPTMDHAISRTVEQIATPIKNTMLSDLTRLEKRVLASKNPVTEDLLRSSLPVALITLLTIGDKDRRDLLFPATYENGGIDSVSGPYGLTISSRGVEKPAKDNDGDVIQPIDEILKTLEQNVTINKDNNTVEVSLTNNNSAVILEIKPAGLDSDGNPVYENNIELKATISDMPALGVSGTQTLNINLTDLDANPSAKLLPLSLQQHLDQFPLEKNSSLTPQAQYFGQLAVSNIQSSEFDMPEELKNTVKSLFSNQIFWSTWSSVLDTLSESIANAELLQEYQLDITDDILDGFNPLYIMPGIGLLFATIAIGGGDDEINAAVEQAYNGRYYRKEMTNFKISPPNPDSDASGDQLINFQRVKGLVQENYDFSRYYNPNSDELGMPHYAILRGLISAFTQVFVGEAYIKGIVPLSKMPLDIVLQDDALSELIAQTMLGYINNSPPGFSNIMEEVITGMFEPCNASLPYTPDNPENANPFPGVAKSLTALGDVDFEISDWQDGLRYLVKQDIAGPKIYLENRIGAFRTFEDNNPISTVNPVSAVSFPKLLQVHDQAFNQELDNTSLATTSRIELFKDGKFFFQYYFQLTDWEPGDEKYIEALVNRDSKYKGILSADNFKELLSLMTGIPQLYPPNTPPTDPILSINNDDSQGENLSNMDLSEYFKDIEFGIRWCYGAVTTDASNEDGELLIPNQPPLVKELFNSVFSALELEKLNNDNKFDWITGNYYLEGDHQSAKKNQYIEYAKETKTLLLVENSKVMLSAENTTGVDNWLDPIFTIVMPLFSEKVSIKKENPNVFDPDENGKGYQFLNQSPAEANFVSDQLEIFSLAGYGQKTMKHLVDKIALHPAYEGVLRYTFPVPKMCSLLIAHSIILASQSTRFNSAFNPTKRMIRALIANTYHMRGKKNQYQNDFLDPYE